MEIKYNSSSQIPPIREDLILIYKDEIFIGYYDDCRGSCGERMCLQGEDRVFWKYNFLGCIPLRYIDGWITLESLHPGKLK